MNKPFTAKIFTTDNELIYELQQPDMDALMKYMITVAPVAQQEHGVIHVIFEGPKDGSGKA